jgi:hypothetical protein
MSRFIFSLCFITVAYALNAQFGYGLTATNDLYHRYSNPKDGIASPSAGSAILNLGVGPKIWIGSRKVTFSAEALANIGFLGLASKDYKGLGTVSYPIMGKLNFNGLSGLDKEGQLGFSIGGGIQYAKTELFGLSDEYKAKGVKRSLFKTYIAQAGYGFGLSGFAVQGFLRYGWNKEKANTYSVGIQWDFNYKQLQKISNPESSL